MMLVKDPHRAVGEPFLLLDLLARVERRAGGLVADHGPVDAIPAGYVITTGDSFLGDDRQVVGVRGVVAADRDHDVQRMLQKREESVLPVLSSRADGVEELEMITQVLRPVTLRHRLPKLLANGQRLTHEHRGLVGDTYPLEVLVRVEAGGHAVAELLS